jgi:hypothetical protein
MIRDNNVGADVLSKLGSDRANVPPGFFVHEFHHPSIKTPDQSTIAQGSIELDWLATFLDFIEERKLPPGIDPKSVEAARILRRSKEYVLVGDNLYKHGSASSILMNCVHVEEGREILQEIHEGACRNHAASHTLVEKASDLGSTGRLLW